MNRTSSRLVSVESRDRQDRVGSTSVAIQALNHAVASREREILWMYGLAGRSAEYCPIHKVRSWYPVLSYSRHAVGRMTLERERHKMFWPRRNTFVYIYIRVRHDRHTFLSIYRYKYISMSSLVFIAQWSGLKSIYIHPIQNRSKTIPWNVRCVIDR